MLISIPLFLVSLIPSILLYIWLKKQPDMPKEYTDTCRIAFRRGFLCVFPVVLLSFVLYILGNIAMRDRETLIYQAYYKFFVLAFAEELVKFLTMRKIIRSREASWLEITIIMALVGLGFEISEGIVYAIGADFPTMMVRGITIMHAAFGFVMGYFYGKAQHTGRKGFAVLGFALAWFMHGAYDFGLSDQLMAISDDFAFISLSLATFSIVLLILFIRFVRKARGQVKYFEAIQAKE